jgi:hypothetical protein
MQQDGVSLTHPQFGVVQFERYHSIEVQLPRIYALDLKFSHSRPIRDKKNEINVIVLSCRQINC